MESYHFGSDSNDLTLKKEIEIIFEQINKIERNEDRFYKTWINSYSKHSKISEVYLKSGQDHEEKMEGVEALQYYNKSLAHAEANSFELVRSYSGRSSILFKSARYEECIRDCESALNLTSCTDSLRSQLNCRKIMSFGLLKHPDTHVETANILYSYEQSSLDDRSREMYTKIALRAYEQIREDLLDENTFYNDLKKSEMKFVNDREVRRKQMLDHHFTPNDEIPSISEKLRVYVDPNGGRIIKAASDINIGEILIFEKCYEINIRSEQKYLFCENCLNTHWSACPCDTCAAVMYCSRKCMLEHWNKCHKFECNTFPTVWGNRLYDPVAEEYKENHLPVEFILRLALIVVQRAGGISKLKEELRDLERLKEINEKQYIKEIFSSDKNASLLSLPVKPGSNQQLSHKIKEVLLYSPSFACQAAYYLAINTKFFGKQYNLPVVELLKIEDITYMAALILRITMIYINNNMSSFFAVNLHNQSGNQSVTYGYALNAVSNFIKHSCDPNTILIPANDKQSIVFAIRQIKEGTELSMSHSRSSYAILTSDEIQNLRKNCSCTACTGEWKGSKDTSYKELLQDKSDNLLKEITREYKKFLQVANKLDDICVKCTMYKPDSFRQMLKVLNLLESKSLLHCKESNLIQMYITNTFLTVFKNPFFGLEYLHQDFKKRRTLFKDL